MCQSEGTHRIIMSFSPAVVSYLLKKGLQTGRRPVLVVSFMWGGKKGEFRDWTNKGRVTGTPGTP